jgi:hypothetical protein
MLHGPKIITAQDVAKYCAERNQQATVCQTFEYPRSFTALANSKTTVEIPFGNSADTEILGYNIEYDAAPDGLEYLYLQFTQEMGNRKWSSDFVSIRNIATPGVRGTSTIAAPARYGYRQFFGWAQANDKLKIECQNNHPTANLRVEFSLHGVLYFK